MTGSIEPFTRAVALEPASPTRFDVAFTARTQYVPWPKAYGGDLVAQAAAAALRTVDADRRLHSMHSYFMRPADVEQSIHYEVEVLRDGRGFSQRQVRAYQNDAVLYAAMLSFQVAQPDDSFALAAPVGIPDPDDLPSSADSLVGVDSDAARYWSDGRSFDHRHVPGPLYTSFSGERVASQAIWIRAFEALPDDTAMHQIALAYACDYTILEPLLRQRGIHWSEPGLVTASLDHSMWFHRDARLDDWVLYVQEGQSDQSERGLATGRFFDRAGRLIATVAQEGLIRQS